jgi:hypothetical protein
MKYYRYLIGLILCCVYYPYHATCSHPPFRQQVNHSIKATLLDPLKSINVEQTIEYINHSPDTLNEIYMHLWANAFKNNKTRFAKQQIDGGNYDFHFADSNELGGYSFINFEVDGRKLSWSNHNNNDDIAILYLASPLLPTDTLMIEIRYNLVFPDARFSRPGHHNGAFYATQWYPKPAVYDRNGWNPFPYLHFGEFYSEFGNYDVSITVPADYVVASSGILQNTEEIEFLKQLSLQTSQEGAGAVDVTEKHHKPTDQLKTLDFKQSNIHDFAWFADRNFRVLIDSTQPINGKPIQLYSFFTHDAHHWFQANKIMAETLHYMSEKAGPYPWSQCTAVQGVYSGGANMEYPAITMIDKKNSTNAFESVIVHEVIHNWFYGVIASNERKEPWIDEGFTTYYENRFFREKNQSHPLFGSFSQTGIAEFFQVSHLTDESMPYYSYMLKAAQHLDQPVGSHSEELSEINYFAMAYLKPAMLIRYLEEYLGQDKFDSIIQSFYTQWQFNHPSTTDIREFFENHTSSDLSWFFDDWIATNKKADFKINSIKDVENGYLISLSNRGRISSPVPVSAVKNGVAVKSIWVEPFKNKTELFFPGSGYDIFRIDHDGLIPEINRRNNTIKTAGWPKKEWLPELQFLAGIDDPHKRRMYWVPIPGYNANDGFMAGLAFYNYVFPVAQNDFFLMPLYSTKRDDLSGTAWYYRDFYPTGNAIHSLRAGTRIKRYGIGSGNNNPAYNQLKTSLRATLTPALSSRKTETYIKFSNFMIWQDNYVFENGTAKPVSENYYANRLDLSHHNQSVVNPYRLDLELLQANQMIRTSFTAKISFPLNANKKGLHLRFFAGTFLLKPDNPSAPDFRFSLQGMTSARDPLHDHIFLGANRGAGTFWGNQMTETYGNFRYPTPLGLTWEWLTALNVTYDLPVIPLRVFMDTGTYSGASKDIIGTQKFPYVAGVQATLFNDVVQVNFPVFVSDDIKKIAELNKLSEYYQRITFMIRFDKINPLHLRRKMHLLIN